MTVRPHRNLVAAALVAAVAAACSEPQLPDTPPEPIDGEVPQAEEQADDLQRDRLSAALADLHDAMTAAEDELRSAADAGSLAAVRSAAQRSLDRLLDDQAGPGTPALLPTVSPERGNIGDRDDLLSATLAAARDVGGDHGDAVVALLRDEVAGDLGAWERDAEGVVASVTRTAEQGGDPDALTAAVLELPGEATRALAWTLFAVDADDLDRATTAASRAASHLELASLAIDDLRPTLQPDAAGEEREGG